MGIFTTGLSRLQRFLFFADCHIVYEIHAEVSTCLLKNDCGFRWWRRRGAAVGIVAIVVLLLIVGMVFLVSMRAGMSGQPILNFNVPALPVQPAQPAQPVQPA
jgi:hypothetical protein